MFFKEFPKIWQKKIKLGTAKNSVSFEAFKSETRKKRSLISVFACLRHKTFLLLFNQTFLLESLQMTIPLLVNSFLKKSFTIFSFHHRGKGVFMVCYDGSMWILILYQIRSFEQLTDPPQGCNFGSLRAFPFAFINQDHKYALTYCYIVTIYNCVPLHLDLDF